MPFQLYNTSPANALLVALAIGTSLGGAVATESGRCRLLCAVWLGQAARVSRFKLTVFAAKHEPQPSLAPVLA